MSSYTELAYIGGASSAGQQMESIDIPQSSQQQQQQQQSDFEKSRRSYASAVVSNYPHVQANTTPLLGPDNFMQWFSPPWVLLFYFLAEVFGSAAREFFTSAAYFSWSGVWGLNILMRAMIVGAGYYFYVIVWAQWTGAYHDLWTLMNAGFSEMFFSKKFGAFTSSSGLLTRFSVLGKILVLLIAQWVGSVIGMALYAWVKGLSVRTSDCNTDPALACYIAPSVVGAVSDDVAARNAFAGHLLIASAYFISWGVVKRLTLWVALLTKTFVHAPDAGDHHNNLMGSIADDNQVVDLDSHNELQHHHERRRMIDKSESKYVPWQINDNWSEMAKIVGVATFGAHVIFSDVNNGFNFWSFFVSSLFTGNWDGAKIFVWPGLAANLVIFVMQLIHWLLASSSASYRSTVLEEVKNKNKIN